MKRVIVGDAGCLTAPDGAALPGALDAVAHLNRGGFTVIVATDIPALATHGQAMAAASGHYAQLQQALGALGGRIDAVFFCSAPPGAFESTFADLLRDIALRYEQPPLELHAIFARPDEWRATLAAGITLHRVENENRPAGEPPLPASDAACPDFATCAQALLAAAGGTPDGIARGDSRTV